MTNRLTRRAVVSGAFGGVIAARGRSTRAQDADSMFSYPIGRSGDVLGNGFLIRHGFSCENTWYNPGWWHCGEDWYALEGDTAGAGIYAVGDGEVVFAGSDYPGRVVIVRHEGELFSMYGHLDDALAVTEGESVARGQPLGTVLQRTDGGAPSHLHFEMRTFLMADQINGNAPLYGVKCGVNCAPGPGYWPISAPELPVELGWRNASHTLHELGMEAAAAHEVVVAGDVAEPLPFWSVPGDRDDAEQIGELDLAPGERLTWIATATRDPAAAVTSAEGYRLWYRVESADGERGWVEAAVASASDTGSDGRPSTVRFKLLPAVTP